jgi:hypothetical protein
MKVKKVINILKENIVSIWGFVLTFLISGVWFFQDGYILMTDLVHGPNREYLWNSSTILMNAVLYAGDFISAEFSSKFVYFSTFIVLYFAGVNLAKNFTKEKYLQILAGSFTVLNLFVYERILYGQVGVVLALAFCTFFFAYIYKIHFKFEDKNNNILLAGLFGGLAIDSSLHVVFFLGFTLSVFSVFKLSELYKNDLLNFKNFINILLQNILILIISIFVNLGFIINSFLGRNDTLQFTSSRITSLDLTAFQTAGVNIFEKLFNVLMLTGFWGREQKRFIDITDNPLWFIAFLPFVFIIIIGLYKIYLTFRSAINKSFFYICISFLLIVPFLSIATSLPFLDFLYKYIPFYSGLREPQKWTMLLIPVYIVAIIFGLKQKQSLENTVSNNVIATFFMIILFIFNYRFLFGMWGQMKAVEYPESWYKINQIIEKENIEKYSQKCIGKNLFLPWHLYLSFPFAENVIANPSSVFFSCPFIGGTNMEFGNIFDNNLNDNTNKYGHWLFENSKFPPPENTNFIVVSKTVDYERYNWLKESVFIEKIFEDADVLLYRVK